MDDQVRADFEKMGRPMPAEEESDEDVFELWDVNLASFEAFAALETQWRVVALMNLETARREYLGLDYAAVDVVLRRRGLDDAEAFADIQAMEVAALEARVEVADR